MISEERPAMKTPQPHPSAGAPLRSFGGIVTVSETMDQVFNMARKFAASGVAVLILGETGTGKGLIARAIHRHSPRATGAFVSVGCGALPPELLGNELFGQTASSALGAFERASNGTIFLDEIKELPLEHQLRLVRLLDERTGRKGKVASVLPSNVGVVAACSLDLEAEVSAKRFRRDLYFRLAASVLRIPPLRQRMEDLPVIVDSLLADLGRADIEVEAAVFELLRSHSWPGNVRELKNVLASALAVMDGQVMQAQHVHMMPSAPDHVALERLPLAGQSLALLERVAIQQTLAQLRGNKIQAAKLLGIAPSTLYEKLKRYGI